MLIGALFAAIIVFGAVILRGAPYLPTMRRDVEHALDLIDLKPGQTLLELGSGDGIVAKAAAERGLNVVGYELNPLLVLASRIRCRKYENVEIIWGDYWRKTWPPSDGMYVFLLDNFMTKLNEKVEDYRQGKPYKLVSHSFQIKEKKHAKSHRTFYLYLYK